jgi:hypothetical protein
VLLPDPLVVVIGVLRSNTVDNTLPKWLVSSYCFGFLGMRIAVCFQHVNQKTITKIGKIQGF